MKVQELNCKQARQVLYLLRFDFTLKHVPGTKIEKADRLSRQSDQKIRVENNNDNQIFIKDNWIYSLKEVVIEGPEIDIVEKIKKTRSKNKEVVRIVKKIKKVRVKELRGEKQKVERKLVLKEEKIYVPKDVELRSEIIWLYYNVPVAEHGG